MIENTQILEMLRDSTSSDIVMPGSRIGYGWRPNIVIRKLLDNGWQADQAQYAVKKAIVENKKEFFKSWAFASWLLWRSGVKEKDKIAAMLHSEQKIGLDLNLALAIAYSIRPKLAKTINIIFGVIFALILILSLAFADTIEGALIGSMVMGAFFGIVSIPINWGVKREIFKREEYWNKYVSY